MRKRNILRALGFTVILWGIGVVAVNNNGMASCVSQSGMTGFLHKALFAPTPACALLGDHKTCAGVSGVTTCNLSTSLSPGNGTSGVCTQTQTGCACIAVGKTY